MAENKTFNDGLEAAAVWHEEQAKGLKKSADRLHLSGHFESEQDTRNLRGAHLLSANSMREMKL